MNYLGGMEGGTGDGTAATNKGAMRVRSVLSPEARDRLKAEWEQANGGCARGELFVGMNGPGDFGRLP